VSSFNALYTSAQALAALGVSINVHANNIANVSTDDFQPQRASFETGPGGQGVRIAELATSQAGGYEAPAIEAEDDPDGAVIASQRSLINNGVDLAEEFTYLSLEARAFEANAAALRTEHEAVGYVMDALA
jgi:flagellar basal-body rod protein FlgC